MAAVCLLAAGTARASPQDPVPLRSLVRAAGWVGVADVSSALDGRMTLRVVEVLVGPPLGVIEVACVPPSNCASGPRPGRALVCLVRDGDGWRLPHASTRPVADAASRAALVARAREALAQPAGATARVRAEHALRCLEHPATSWDGAIELALDPDLRAALTDAERARLRPAWRPLPDELARLTLVPDPDGVGVDGPATMPGYVRLGPTRLALVLVGAALGEVELEGPVLRHVRLLARDGPDR